MTFHSISKLSRFDKFLTCFFVIDFRVGQDKNGFVNKETVRVLDSHLWSKTSAFADGKFIFSRNTRSVFLAAYIIIKKHLMHSHTSQH